MNDLARDPKLESDERRRELFLLVPIQNFYHNPKSVEHIKEAAEKGDANFFIKFGRALARKQAIFPSTELSLVHRWLSRKPTHPAGNLCLWSDEMIAGLLKHLGSSHTEASFRKMRQRLGLVKAKNPLVTMEFCGPQMEWSKWVKVDR